MALAESAPCQQPPCQGRRQRQGFAVLKTAMFWQEREKALQKFGYDSARWQDGAGCEARCPWPERIPGLLRGREALTPVRCRGRCVQPCYLPPYGELKVSESSCDILLALATGRRKLVGPRGGTAGGRGPSRERSPASPASAGDPGVDREYPRGGDYSTLP